MKNGNVRFKNNTHSILRTSDVQNIDVNFRTSDVKRFLTFILIFTFLFLNFSNAQTSPQFLSSWRAENYASSWYQGKILPTYQSPVEISFELIDTGKTADLSKTKVRWYVNDNLVLNENNGLGIKNLKVNIPDYATQETEIRIAVVDYKGGEQLDEIIKIPVARPEVVINAPYPDNKINTGSSIFQTIPFFFNIKHRDALTVEWSANEQRAEGVFDNPWELELNIDSRTPSGFAVNLRAVVRNILNELEIGSKNIQLQIK